MAEFCLDCMNKINGTKDSKRKYVISKDLELCEGCGEWKHVVIRERGEGYYSIIRYIFFPIWIIFYIIYRLWLVIFVNNK